MEKEICKNCKGKGWTRNFGNYFLGLFTLGISFNAEKLGNKCKICKGRGFIYKK
jgi:hypothetical protein